jgi:hypothetical protein
MFLLGSSQCCNPCANYGGGADSITFNNLRVLCCVHLLSDFGKGVRIGGQLGLDGSGAALS